MCIACLYLMVELVPNYSGLAYNVKPSAVGFIVITWALHHPLCCVQLNGVAVGEVLWHCSRSASVYLLESSEQFGYGCGSAFQGTEVPKSKTNRHKDNFQASCVQLSAPFLSGGPQLLGLMPNIQFLVTIQTKGLCLTYLAGRPCPT